MAEEGYERTDGLKVENAFSDFERTTRVVTTNGLNLPLDENAFTDFIESIGRPYIMLSCSDAHLAQYATLARGGRFPYHVPCQVAPENSLADKAATIEEYCRRLDVGFTDNVVESRESESKLAKDLRGYILKSAKKEPKIFSTEIDGFRHPCSQGQELSIRSNGRMYPHCYDIFNGTNYIGRIGLLQNR